MYGSWSIVQLKEELRKRGARLSGRKHELVDRLVSVSLLCCHYNNINHYYIAIARCITCAMLLPMQSFVALVCNINRHVFALVQRQFHSQPYFAFIYRLEAYDRNFNFGKDGSIVADDYHMSLPDSETYKDINTDSKVKSFFVIFYIGVMSSEMKLESMATTAFTT